MTAPLNPVVVTASVGLSTVSLNRGEYMTVWLEADHRRIQVELHVEADGTPRVLLRDEYREIVRSFAEVYGGSR